jgi:hypothetical protein
MKRLLLAAALAAASAQVLAADVGVSITVGQPGFYGRLDIGDFPPPQLIYNQPVVVGRVIDNRPPIYLHVPPGHAKHWRKHCHEYHACGERVLFVQDNWYDHEYVPRYQERHGSRMDDRRNDRRDYRQDDNRDNPHRKDNQHGNGKGKGHDRGYD